MESTHCKHQYDQKKKASTFEPGDLCLVRQKVFGGKHSIGDFWENTKYVVVEWQPNVPVYTIKPWQGEGSTWVVQRNLLMHKAHPHKQDKMQPDSGDSEYDTPSGDLHYLKQYWTVLGQWHRARPRLIG